MAKNNVIKTTFGRNDNTKSRGVQSKALLDREKEMWNLSTDRNDLTKEEYIEGVTKLIEHLKQVKQKALKMEK